MAIPALKYISSEEYLSLEKDAKEKHEYFDGQVIAMVGATEEHNRIVANLMRDIGSFLKGKDCDVFPSDFRVATPSSDSYMYPDVSIVCGHIQKKEAGFDTLLNPSVIIEVMSDNTKSIDRGYKFFSYQQIISLQEYILIDSLKYEVQSICRTANNLWAFNKIETLDSFLLIETIQLQLPLSDIYYRVQL
jgi:Uma2 family endonuclease